MKTQSGHTNPSLVDWRVICRRLLAGLILAGASALAANERPDIHQRNVQTLADWVYQEKGRKRTPDTTLPSLVGKSVELKGYYRFDGATGQLEFSSKTLRHENEPDSGRGEKWSGIKLHNRDFRQDTFIINMELYCQKSASYTEELATVVNRQRESYAAAHLISWEIPATIRGIIQEVGGSLATGAVRLKDGCSVEFDVPAWTDTLKQQARRITVSPHIAQAAAQAEEGASWKPKQDIWPFTQAFMQDGIYDADELAFVDLILNRPGAYLLETGAGEAVPFRNFWVPLNYDSNTSTFRDSRGILYTGLRVGEVPSQLRQALEANWQGEVIDSLMIHNAYTDHKLSGEITYAVIVQGFSEAMLASNIGNTYSPVRQKISACFATINTLPEAQQAEVRETLWYLVDRAAASARHQNHPVPEFLYNWIRPAKAE